MNKTISTLNKANIGDVVKIKEIKTLGSMRRRLQDIGLIEGTPVECVHVGPGGDPVAYLIRGAVIAIRNEDSAKILVE